LHAGQQYSTHGRPISPVPSLRSAQSVQRVWRCQVMVMAPSCRRGSSGPVDSHLFCMSSSKSVPKIAFRSLIPRVIQRLHWFCEIFRRWAHFGLRRSHFIFLKLSKVALTITQAEFRRMQWRLMAKMVHRGWLVTRGVSSSIGLHCIASSHDDIYKGRTRAGSGAGTRKTLRP
jgi:hypothetical protein